MSISIYYIVSVEFMGNSNIMFTKSITSGRGSLKIARTRPDIIPMNCSVCACGDYNPLKKKKNVIYRNLISPSRKLMSWQMCVQQNPLVFVCFIITVNLLNVCFLNQEHFISCSIVGFTGYYSCVSYNTFEKFYITIIKVSNRTIALNVQHLVLRRVSILKQSIIFYIFILRI